MKTRFLVCLIVLVLIFNCSSSASAGELPQPAPLPGLASTPSLPSILAFGTPAPPSALENTRVSMPGIEFWDENVIEKTVQAPAPSRPRGIVPANPAFAGTLLWPISGLGRISSGFGPRFDRELNHMRMHEGIDIPAPRGTPIRAAAAGVVLEARSFRGYGRTVIIDHGNGLRTLYAHCSRLSVRRGDLVESGQTIAYVGSTGRSNAPHLHFAVMHRGAYRNPMAFLRDRPQQVASIP